MHDTTSNSRKYVLAVTLGAIAGGLIVAYATRAMPKMMSGMMQKMMGHLAEEGCNPAEM